MPCAKPCPLTLVQSLYFSNPKFQASSHLLWLSIWFVSHLIGNLQDKFSHDMAQFVYKEVLSSENAFSLKDADRKVKTLIKLLLSQQSSLDLPCLPSLFCPKTWENDEKKKKDWPKIITLSFRVSLKHPGQIEIHVGSLRLLWTPPPPLPPQKNFIFKRTFKKRS